MRLGGFRQDGYVGEFDHKTPPCMRILITNATALGDSGNEFRRDLFRI